MYKYLHCLCLIISVSVVVVSAATCGSYTATDGTNYDLTGLTKARGAGYKVTDGGSYTYFFNLCDNYVTQQTTTYCYVEAPAYQMSATNLCFVLGVLPPVITDGVNGPDTGVTIKYTNEEDRCQFGSIPRTVVINIKCDHKVEAVQSITEPSTCVYDFAMTSPSACPLVISTGSNDDGLSPGSIFLILLLVAVVVYLVGGALFRYKFQDVEVSANLIPNLPFWTAIPGLVKDGCVFTYEKIKTLSGR